MFGYVTPCKMELKVKDYEKFKAYYCGLCKSIKHNFGNIPRVTLNYDMTFLAVLLDAFSEEKNTFVKEHCLMHPLNKKLIILDNEALDYSAFCNILLAYYKLLDDVYDDKSIKSHIFSGVLNKYISRSDKDLQFIKDKVKFKLKELQEIEVMPCDLSLDRLADPFADLTGFIVSAYYKDEEFKNDLYFLGYNLGKWIYVIDAMDDLEEDMKKGKFNAINAVFNKDNLDYSKFKSSIENDIEFTLINCGIGCFNSLKNLPLKKNRAILENILHFGFMEKIDKVLKRSENTDERSI